mgnify:CR=1 FL=1
MRTLGQLYKFPTEDIIQAQPPGDLLSDIQTVSASSIDVDFLKNENIGIRIPQEIYDRSELQATIDVPIDYPYGTARPGQPLARRKVLGNDLVGWHDSNDSWDQVWKNTLLGKAQIQRIIDFGPGQSLCACIADVHSLVCKFLHSDIEEVIEAARSDELVQFEEKSVLD